MTLDSRDNWIFRIKSDMAFAIYDEVFLLNTGIKVKGKTQKVMEKVNGQWKIATTAAICDFNNAIIPTPNPEEETLKKVAFAETDAYVKRDFKAWADCYMDAPTTSIILTPNGNPGGLIANADFQKISKGMKSWMDASPQSEMQVESRTGWVSRIMDNMAWISYDQKNIMVKTGAKIKSKELKVLEKAQGQWKITSSSAVWDFEHTEYGTPNLEEEEIKKVIIAGTDAWIEGNLEAYTSLYVNKPYFLWSVTNGNEPGDVLTLRGWDALKDFMQQRFQKRDSQIRETMGKNKITRDKWAIEIRGNVAYVSFNQNTENEKQKLDSTETRVLEKINGVWKVAMQTSLVDFKDATPPIRSKY